jgi:hypothetical protein
MKQRFKEIFSKSGEHEFDSEVAATNCEQLALEMMEKLAVWVDSAPYVFHEGKWKYMKSPADTSITTRDLIDRFLSEQQ